MLISEDFTPEREFVEVALVASQKNVTGVVRMAVYRGNVGMMYPLNVRSLIEPAGLCSRPLQRRQQPLQPRVSDCPPFRSWAYPNLARDASMDSLEGFSPEDTTGFIAIQGDTRPSFYSTDANDLPSHPPQEVWPSKAQGRRASDSVNSPRGEYLMRSVQTVDSHRQKKSSNPFHEIHSCLLSKRRRPLLTLTTGYRGREPSGPLPHSGGCWIHWRLLGKKAARGSEDSR